MTVSDFTLLGDFKNVVDRDTQVPHGRFQLGVAKQQLHGSQVLSASIDQRDFGPSHRMGPILGSIQTKLTHPVTENLSVLPGSKVGGIVEPARKEKVVRFQFRLLDPRLQGLSGDNRDLEMHWALGIVLHDDDSVGHLIALGRVADFE